MLDEVVEIFFDVRRPWRRQYAAVAQSPRAKFGRALKPSNYFPRQQQLYGVFSLAILHDLERIASLAVVENIFDLVPGVGGSPIGVQANGFSRSVLHLMLQV